MRGREVRRRLGRRGCAVLAGVSGRRLRVVVVGCGEWREVRSMNGSGSERLYAGC